MSKNPIFRLIRYLKRLYQPINLRHIFKSIYYFLAPMGSKRYIYTHTILRRVMNYRYRYWIRHYDTYTDKDLNHFRNRSAAMPVKPIISIILPVYNPNINFLDQAINAVRDQIYPYWELCIADDASTKAGVRELIESHCLVDSRIHAVFRELNGHISAASNSALEIATGDYIALLDHDDVMHTLALYFVADEINNYPESEVIYSDEDKLTRGGKRLSPYFKSDFDYDLLLSQNMVSHLGVYKTETVRQLGGFRIGFEGSQDYDLLLRMIEVIKTYQIRHISRVLYHWRISNQSAAASIDVKPYAIQAATKALSEHLENQDIKACVEPQQKFGYKINYCIKHPAPFVELFINTNNIDHNLIMGIKSLVTNSGLDFFKLSLYISGDNSENLKEDGFKEFVNSHHQICVHESPMVDIDKMIQSSSAEYVGIIDESCINFSINWLEKLLSLAIQPGVGAVSPKLVYPHNFIYSCGVILGVDGVAQRLFNGVRDGKNSIYYYGWNSLNKGYSALSPECLIFNLRHYKSIGGVREKLTDQTAKLIDFCLKMREAGLRNIFVPSAVVTINEPLNEKTNIPSDELISNQVDRDYFLQRWNKWIKHDPSFNPNLSLIKGKPIVTKKPRSGISQPYIK